MGALHKHNYSKSVEDPVREPPPIGSNQWKNPSESPPVRGVVPPLQSDRISGGRSLREDAPLQAPESTVGQPCGSLSTENIHRIFCRIFEMPCAEWHTSVNSRRLSTVELKSKAFLAVDSGACPPVRGRYPRQAFWGRGVAWV
eukprot:1188947-Prorocentrum_minimum.AAC.2